MPLKPSLSTSSEPLAAGTYPARLYSIIHLGRVPREWQGQMQMVDKVRFTFEFPTETKVFKEENGEQPYVLSCEFTNSLSSKGKLRPFLEGWLGKQITDSEAMNIDLYELMGKEGLANVVHNTANNGNTYANIQSISPLPKGMTCPPQVNESFILDYFENWSQDKFNTLPDFLKEKMMSSENWEAKFVNSEKLGQENKAQFKDGEIDLKDIPF